MNNIEKAWESKWKEILQKPDGSVDIEQLKKELSDFDDLIGRMTALTAFVTRDRLSYPTYPITTLINVIKEVAEEDRETQKEDDVEDGVCSLCGRFFEEKNDQ